MRIGRKDYLTLGQAHELLGGAATPEQTKVLAMRGQVHVPDRMPVGGPPAGMPAESRMGLRDIEAQVLRGLRRPHR